MSSQRDVKPLILAILEFLDEQQHSVDRTPDAAESLEVASQCLESAYGVSVRNSAAAYPLPATLPDIFSKGMSLLNIPDVSDSDKDAAERLKAEGNEFMKSEQYQSAVDCYTRALVYDSRNAVYYCNRACAYSKAGNHHNAIEDCKTALSLDPQYGKAFGRKGLAHSALGQHQEACQCYRQASEIDPANESYRENLLTAEQSLRETRSVNGGTAGNIGGAANLGGMDLSSLLSNPALMNMATSMLSNPQMQSMMANMMGGGGGGGGGGSADSPAVGPQGISSLLQAGQQLAAQMQQVNPEFVEQLRSQMSTEQETKEPEGEDVKRDGSDQGQK